MSLIGNVDTPESYVADYMQACVGMFGIPAGGFVSDIETFGSATSYDVESLYAAMLNSTIGRSIYAPGISNESFATKLVDKVGGGLLSDANKAAAIDEVQALLDGGVSRAATAMAVVEFVAGLETSDETFGAVAQQFQNRIEIANYYTFSSTAPSTTLSTLTAILSSVDNETDVSDPAAVLAANTDPGVSTGQTYTLTSSADSLIGTTGGDTFRGTVTLDTDGVATSAATYNTSDSISGGSGTDTLELTVEGSGTDGVTTNAPAASVSSIETVSIRNVTAATEFFAFNGANVGATEFVVTRSTGSVNFSNIGTADISIVGDGATATGAVAVTSVGAASVTDALTLNLKSGTTTDGTFAVSDSTYANWTAATINSTGATNSFGTINLTSANKVKDLTINATTALLTGNISGFDATAGVTNTITVAGATAATSSNTGVSIGTLADAVDVVDASGLTTGGLTMTLSGTDGATALKVTGGAGQDKITTGNTLLATGAAIDGGAGSSDVLVVADSTHITSTLGEFYKNFETVELSNGTAASIAVDMAHFTTNNTMTAVRVNATSDGTDGASVSNMTATQAAAVTVVGYGATTDGQITLGVKGASDVGQMDTVKLAFDDGSSTTNTISINNTDGGLVLAGVENLELNASADKATVVLGTDAAALTSISLTGAKDINVSLTAAYTINTNSSINGSDATGALTINTSAATDSTAAIALTGGSKADAITFYAGAATAATDAPATVVTAGAGLDTIKANVSATDVVADLTDTMVSFKIVSDVVSTANADLVLMYDSTGTDLASDGVGTDSTWAYKYQGDLSNGSGTIGSGIASGEVVSATTFSGALADGGAANAIVFRATNSLSTSGTTLTTLAGSFTQANADAFIAGLVASGGSLNGTISNLDSILGTTDSALLIMDDGTYSAILRITNTDTSTANTLATSEIALVGVVNVNDLGAGGAAGTITWS